MTDLREAWRKGIFHLGDPKRSFLPPVRPIADGVCASSALVRFDGTPVLPWGLRSAMESQGWPNRLAKDGTIGPYDEPKRETWNNEVQGVAFFPERLSRDGKGTLLQPSMLMTTVEAVWQVSLFPGVLFETMAPMPRTDLPLSTLDKRVIERLDDLAGEQWARDMIARPSAFDDPGFGRHQVSGYFGRKHLVEGRSLFRPVHLSAPCAYKGLLMVPAEGDRNRDGDRGQVWAPDAWDTRPSVADYTPGVRYQTLYVIDPNNLGYLARIGLPAPNTPLGLGDFFSACAIHEPSGILLATRSGDAKNDRPPVNELYAFRLPSLDGLPLAGSQLAMLSDEAYDARNAIYPTLFAKPIGIFQLRDSAGAKLNLQEVNGLAISPRGHIYVDYEYSNGTEGKRGDSDNGLMGFDLLSGRGVLYESTADVAGYHLQGLAFLPNSERLTLCTWNGATNDWGLQFYRPHVDEELETDSPFMY